MQTTILLFFQKHATPLWDALAQGITFFGEETLFILLIATLLWAVSKSKGFVMFSTLFSALIGMSVLKAIIRYPRPFTVIESLEGKRLATATGYSFPSGHTTGAASFYSAASLTYKKRVISIVCALLIVLVGLSRLYLGVHWPLDVFGGLVLGITVSIIVHPLVVKVYEDKKLLVRFSLIVGIVASLIAALLALLLATKRADQLAYSDPMKLAALAGGGYLAFAWEQTHLHYSTDGSLVLKIIRTLVGLAVVFGIQSLKSLLGSHEAVTLLRYILIGLWVPALYPYLGMKVGLFTSSYPQDLPSSVE